MTHVPGKPIIIDEVQARILVCLEPGPGQTDDVIHVLPVKDFHSRLWASTPADWLSPSL